MKKKHMRNIKTMIFMMNNTYITPSDNNYNKPDYDLKLKLYLCLYEYTIQN